MNDQIELPSLQEIEQMERQRSQAIEALEISSSHVKYQRCHTSMDLKHHKIRVNAISPGLIDTPIFDSLAQTEEEVKQIKANFEAQCLWIEWEVLMRSPKPSHFWHQMTAAILQVLNYL